MTNSSTELLDAARSALSKGDFDKALTSARASCQHADLGEAHDLYANLLFADDDCDGARHHWETAFRLYREDGEKRKAIRAAANLAIMHFADSNEAATRGWISRARRLADAVGRCVERGYLELALVACDVRDATALESAAEIALELALEFDDPNLEARALADGGLAMISQGRIKEGFARLDEAMAPISAGEVSDPSMAGMIFCALLTACERTGDVRRAEEWTRAIETFRASRMAGKFPVLHSHCRLAYGRVLCDAGRLSEAEAELIESLGPAGTRFVPKRAEAAGIFASLRLQQGRIEDAAALLAPYRDRFEICEPLARLYAIRGEPDLAVATILRALHELIGDRLRGGPLLSLLVEIELDRDNLEGAERSAQQLADYAQEAESAVLAAEAKLALGRCALRRGDCLGAVAELVAARRLLGEDQRPILGARIRLDLAYAMADSSRVAEAIDEAQGALIAFERLGASRDADRTAALLRTLGATGRAKPRSSGTLTPREQEVLALLGQGLTNADIAQRLFITSKTAEHHVGKILVKLNVRNRAEAAAFSATEAARS